MKRDLLLAPDAPALASTAREDSQWRHAWWVLGLALTWTLAWYASTAKSMVQIWARSDTFAHGFVVIPIVLWLVWRKREQLAASVPRPAWWALAGVAVAGFAWLLGQLSAVNALSQFALVALLVMSVVAVLGTRVAHTLAFALCFLFFAVPIGEFLTPQLMDWTADFTILALRASGVPVYREGLHFVIPSGSWSVVEACSGFRYLVASLMVGMLFAYLSYRSLKRRLIFAAFALLVPIVANWLRAYMIVMLGHLSGNKLAAGVDHLIYGWLFFGVVIGSLFWIGARWREDHLDDKPLPRAASIAPGPASRLWIAAAAVAGLALVWKVSYWGMERSDASAPPQLSALVATGDWLPTADAVSTWRPHFENPSAELHRTFRRGDQSVGLVVAYYRNQDDRRELVNSNNALVRSSDWTWVRVAGGTRGTMFDGAPLTVRTTELRGEHGQRLQVWQWYWINGRLTADDHWAKAYTVLSRLQGRHDDSAAIIVYTPKDQPGGAESALESFIRATAPRIESALRETSERR